MSFKSNVNRQMDDDYGGRRQITKAHLFTGTDELKSKYWLYCIFIPDTCCRGKQVILFFCGYVLLFN